ncbi:hypothetical protein BDY24DRAFT_394996 [Mrakia frigida]|uniref:uncharacterized protein n=1 Tax=Mrakia frigida TaxID=29902 RepID=UPI003FCC0CFC
MDDLPPPAYTALEPYPLPTLSTLPFSVLTLIIHHLVRSSSSRSKLDLATSQQWLSKEARLTSRMFYRVIQTYLRTLHLPSYLSHVRPPFSSSPLPSSPFAPPIPTTSITALVGGGGEYQQHETGVLDLFVAALVREQAEGLESEGFGESMNWREDVFTLYQPQARLLDLLLQSLTHQPTQYTPVSLSFPPTTLSLRFTARKLTLFRTIHVDVVPRTQSSSAAGGGATRKRELVTLTRERGEKEEVSVDRMREGLRALRVLEEG